ncbi:MAG: right-handed parallel beta-helix repeat-containing protein [Kiritimatiellae bacterium]|nr:right-handed parallel beta-helix repeat-containing protein [Kiritimatiellia bacterium]
MKYSVLTLAIILVAGTACAGWEEPPPGFVLKPGQKVPSMSERLAQIKPVKAGELQLVPTYVSCSVYWGVKGEVEGLRLEYRAVGADSWRTAENPVYFDDAENYRGSILDIREDTAYEARIAAGGRTLASGTFRTWRSDVPIAKTVVIDPKTAAYPIVISDRGTPDGWIRYTTKPGEVLGSDSISNCSIVVVRNASNVVLEGLTVQGGGGNRDSAVFIENSKGVRVRNCEIFGFGHAGRQVFTDNGRGCFFDDPNGSADPSPGRFIDWHAGVMIYPGTEEITVERCYIHDPRGRSNSWYYSHPAGMQGIFVYQSGGSIVLRWNDIVGSDLHRWNDAIEGCENFSVDGGLNRDSDVYGNFCIYANDDCVELDGGQQNVRCFRNRFESAFCDVSIQGCMASPVYLYENLFAPCCDEFGQANLCVKTYDFDMYWYAPYAYVRGNWFGESDYEPTLGATSRWDWREDNVFVSNNVPDKVSRRLPARKLPFMLDRGIIKGVKVSGAAASAAETTIIAQSLVPQPFRVRKNLDADWFTVSPSEGELKVGENVFTVTFHPDRMADRRQWRGAFLVRTPEGLSRCVSVYAEKTDFEQPARPVESARTVYAAPSGSGEINAGKAASTPVEVEFDIPEEGDYWLFIRGKTAWGRSRVRISVDGSEFKPTLLTMWPTHAAWNMLRPDADEYTSSGGFEPFRLNPGLHVLRILPLRGSPATVLGFAASDTPLVFEPR